MDKKISKNISYKEAIRSKTAKRKNIDNTPNADQLKAMKLTAENIFQPVREHYNVPIYISSFFRSKALNKAIGGSTNSQHCKGEAIDMDADVYEGITNADIFNYIKDNLDFDQLIWEFGNDENPEWVHASYKTLNNRKSILVAYKQKNWRGKLITKYKKYEQK